MFHSLLHEAVGRLRGSRNEAHTGRLWLGPRPSGASTAADADGRLGVECARTCIKRLRQISFVASVRVGPPCLCIGRGRLGLSVVAPRPVNSKMFSRMVSNIDFNTYRVCSFLPIGVPFERVGTRSLRVTTLWYRAPELVCRRGQPYDYSVDVWSFCCVAAECEQASPLFPAVSEMHLLELQLRLLGRPRQGVLSTCRKLADLSARPMSRPSARMKEIGIVYGRLFKEFIFRGLRMSPEGRSSTCLASLQRAAWLQPAEEALHTQ